MEELVAPRSRFERLDPDRQEAILDVATREFAEHGEDASFNKILTDAGVSKGAAYYYFDDKKDLFTTVVARVVDRAARLIGGVGPIETADDFWREFRQLSERVLNFLREHPTLAKLAQRFAASYPPSAGPPGLEERYGAFRAWIAGLMRRGQEVGAIRTDLPLDLLVTMMYAMGEAFDRWTIARFGEVSRTKESLRTHVEKGFEVFERAFSPPEKPPRG
jgi:AcrR family transcriptional regulator